MTKNITDRPQNTTNLYIRERFDGENVPKLKNVSYSRVPNKRGDVFLFEIDLSEAYLNPPPFIHFRKFLDPPPVYSVLESNNYTRNWRGKGGLIN